MFLAENKKPGMVGQLKGEGESRESIFGDRRDNGVSWSIREWKLRALQIECRFASDVLKQERESSHP